MESICNVVFTIIILIFVEISLNAGLVEACTALTMLMYMGVSGYFILSALFIGVRKMRRNYSMRVASRKR